MDIIAHIKGQVLRIPRKKLIAGSRDYIGMQIIYRTADWAGLSVTAFFAAVADPKNIYTVPVVSGRVPPDKHLNLTAGDWKIWMVGLDIDGTQKISTQAETITVDPTGCSCDDFPEVPPSYAEDFERRLSRLERDGVGPGGGGGGPSDAVRYGPQELTEDEKRQARENIGAGAVADISAQVQQATSAAGAAQQSQRAAATSASNASQYASTAAGSAAGAGTSAQEAAASAESAAGSASAAAGSAQSASGSADTANAAAGRAEAAEIGANSAAETARGHADNAARSAQTASTQAGTAAQSATTATEQASAAAGSAATATSEADRATREADRAEQATPKLEPLTFTGGASAVYDGTKPVTVPVPTGGGVSPEDRAKWDAGSQELSVGDAPDTDSTKAHLADGGEVQIPETADDIKATVPAGLPPETPQTAQGVLNALAARKPDGQPGGGGSKLVLKKTIEVQDGVTDVVENFTALGTEYPVIYIETPKTVSNFGVGLWGANGGWAYLMYGAKLTEVLHIMIDLSECPIPGYKILTYTTSERRNIDYGWPAKGTYAQQLTQQFGGVWPAKQIRLRGGGNLGGAKIYIMARE